MNCSDHYHKTTNSPNNRTVFFSSDHHGYPNSLDPPESVRMGGSRDIFCQKERILGGG